MNQEKTADISTYRSEKQATIADFCTPFAQKEWKTSDRVSNSSRKDAKIADFCTPFVQKDAALARMDAPHIKKPAPEWGNRAGFSFSTITRGVSNEQ